MLGERHGKLLTVMPAKGGDQMLEHSLDSTLDLNAFERRDATGMAGRLKRVTEGRADESPAEYCRYAAA